MYDSLGDALVNAYKMIVAIICISVPLALWKFIDILIWVWSNIHVSIGGP